MCGGGHGSTTGARLHRCRKTLLVFRELRMYSFQRSWLYGFGPLPLRGYLVGVPSRSLLARLEN